MRLKRRITRSITLRSLFTIQLQSKKFLKMIYACKKIQKWWRIVNKKDPISLQRIIVPFLLFRCNSTVLYDATTLKKYIISTGDLRDPICRIPLSIHELKQLDTILPSIPSLISLHSVFADLNDRHVTNITLCDAMERELMKLIYELPGASDFVSVQKLHDEYGAMILQCFGNYKAIDVDRCKITLHNMLYTLDKKISKELFPKLYTSVRNILFALHSEC